MLLGQRAQSKGVPWWPGEGAPGPGGDGDNGPEGGMGSPHGVRSEVCSGGGRARSPRSHNAHWGELFPLRRRKQEGASNLLNFCIDKLSS